MYEKLYDKIMPAGEPVPFRSPEWIACAPFEEYLGMVIEEAAGGRSVLSMPFKVKHAQGTGLMHGGAVTALADTAVALAIKSMLPEDTHFVTTDLSLKVHAPVRYGTVRAVARAVVQDERNIKGEAEIFDEAGRKVATFTALFRVKREAGPPGPLS